LNPRALDATGMLVTLLFLVSLPFGRALVARQSTRPDLTPVLRLKGGAGFNQWIRLFRVVVKGAKGGARSAQRGPAARGTAARGAAMEQGAGFSRLLSVPSSGELAATTMASGSLAGGSSGSTTMAATALAVRPPAVGGPAATSIGAARGSSALSTRSLSAARPQFPAPTLSGVEPCRGVEPCIDLPRSEPPRQRDSTASRYSTRYSTPYYTRYTRYTRYSSTGAAALALAPGAAAGAAPGAAAGATAGAAPGVAAGATAGAAPGVAAGAPATTVLLEVAMWSGAWGLLDAVVDLLAPEDTGARLLLYLVLLVSAQLSPWCRGNSQLLQLLQARLPGAAVQGCGFLTALCLCSGSWGVVDVAVEKLAQCLGSGGSGGSALSPVLSYGGLVLATALGVALHPQRATILDSLSQVSWT